MLAQNSTTLANLLSSLSLISSKHPNLHISSYELLDGACNVVLKQVFYSRYPKESVVGFRVGTGHTEHKRAQAALSILINLWHFDNLAHNLPLKSHIGPFRKINDPFWALYRHTHHFSI